MKSKWISAALAVLMILALLGGCQLAIPDGEMDAEKGTLCGVFITLEYLDTMITEETIELPLGWNGDMNDIVFPETRIWATRHEGDDGFPDFTFDGIDGFRYFVVTVIPTGGTERCTGSVSDGLIQDSHLSYSDNNISMSGTIYFDVHLSDFVIYPNPVYQTQDGEVYMVPGTGTGFNTMGEGDNVTVTLSETTAQTVDGVETSRTMDVEIKAQSLNTNQKIVLKQMDENDQVIAQTEITQDDIPESLKVLADTAYMILEEHSVDYEGKAVVKRTLIRPDEIYFSARFTGDNGIVESHMVTLKSPESGGAL